MLLYECPTDEGRETSKAKAGGVKMRIIESGKHKGKTLAECPKEYLEWASKHEKNFAKRNQWISRDAKFILERREQAKAQETAVKEYEARKEAEMAIKAAEQIVRANSVSNYSLNTSRGFQLMR
jgi:hypothetical protein